MSGVRQQVVARDEDGMRLDRWFATHFPQVTFGHLQKLLRSGQVRVDSGRVKTSTRLDVGAGGPHPAGRRAARERAARQAELEGRRSSSAS